MLKRINWSMGYCAIVALAMLTAAWVQAEPTTLPTLPDVLPYGRDTLPRTPVEKQNQTAPRTVDLLGDNLKDPSADVRVQACTEIGRCELPAGAKYLRTVFADPDPAVRAAAALAAGTVDDHSLTADIKPLLKDSDPRVRRAAVQSGAAMGDGSFIDAGLADADPTVVMAALKLIGTGQASAVTGKLASYPIPAQVIAIDSLGRLGDAANADAVAAMLNHPLPVRVAAVRALGRMKATSKSVDVVKCLSDEHPTIRREAVIALATVLPTSDAQSHWITALADADPSVRETAARQIQASPTDRAIAALLVDLAPEFVNVHDAARDALIAIGSPAIPSAQKLLTAADASHRIDGSYILGQLKSDAGLDDHLKLLSDPDWTVVKQAAISLGLIGRPEAAKPLSQLAAKLMADPSLVGDKQSAMNGAIEQAFVACGLLHEKSVLASCREVLPKKMTYPGNVRAAAAYAIGLLGDPADKSIPSMMMGMIHDQMESGDVQFECVKALGELKSKPVMSVVGTTREKSTFGGDPVSDWLCYWVRSRVSGKQEPLTPMIEGWQAQVSVSSLER